MQVSDASLIPSDQQKEHATSCFEDEKSPPCMDEKGDIVEPPTNNQIMAAIRNATPDPDFLRRWNALSLYMRYPPGLDFSCAAEI